MDQSTGAAVNQQPALTPLQAVNKYFLDQYKKTRDQFWKSTIENGTMIIASGSSLSLIHKGQERAKIEKSIPQIYHELKSISHIPLTIYMLLNDSSFIPTNDLLNDYLSHLKELQLPNTIGSTERLSADHILDTSKDFLQKVVNNNGSVDKKELMEFCQSLNNDLTVLLEAAAIAQLNVMHETVKMWFEENNIKRQDSPLKILIIGPRTARQNNLQTTYFERLLGPERKQNVFYAEELFGKDGNEKAKLIFSTWVYDEQLSIAFFQDSTRMHRDLLMDDHIQRHIEQLLPQ